MRDIEITLRMKSRTHLTIGSGKGEFIHSADIIQLKRTYEGLITPCIPASTLKGILRNSAAQIGHIILGHHNYCKTVDLKSLHNDKEICEICYLFGAGNNCSSKIFCEDAYPLKKEIKLLRNTQTEINRKTGIVKKGSLFTKEQIHPGVEFESKIYIQNLDINNKNTLFLLAFAAIKNMNYCSFGNGNGLLTIKVKDIKNLDDKSNELEELIKTMI